MESREGSVCVMAQPPVGSPYPNLATTAFLRQTARKKRLILGLAALTLLLAVIAINAGAANPHPAQVLRALLGLENGAARVVAAIVTGVGLPVAGV